MIPFLKRCALVVGLVSGDWFLVLRIQSLRGRASLEMGLCLLGWNFEPGHQTWESFGHYPKILNDDAAAAVAIGKRHRIFSDSERALSRSR